MLEYIADRIFVMRAGQIEQQGDCPTALGEPAREYRRVLLAAVPRLQSRDLGVRAADAT